MHFVIQGIVLKRVGIDHAAFRDFLFDDEPQDAARDVRHGTGIDPAVALEKPENSHFPSYTPASIAFAMSAEVRLVNLNFSGERGLVFAFPDDSGTDDVINTFSAVAVNAELARGANRGDLQRVDSKGNSSIINPSSSVTIPKS